MQFHLNFVSCLCVELCVEWHSRYNVETTHLFIDATFQELVIAHKFTYVKAGLFQHLPANTLTQVHNSNK